MFYLFGFALSAFKRCAKTFECRKSLTENTDRCITCREMSPEVTQRLTSTIEDRCRFPWRGGAVQIRLDLVLPVSLVPCATLIASRSPAWTAFAAAWLCASLFLFFRCSVWNRQTPRRSPIFFVFTVTSIFQLFTTYITVVVGFREVCTTKTSIF